MATIVKSPADLPMEDTRLKIFLGGSIDMGNSVNWQANLTAELSDQNIVLLNPRRDDWNKDWKPIKTDSNFRKQVEWELSALELSDIIIMYFAPNSQSPISLLEFGLYAKTNKLMVVCPDGFWRKGNVDIVSERYEVKAFESLDAMTLALKTIIQENNAH
jgi:hypothetical protein